MNSINLFFVLVIWSPNLSAFPTNSAICATIHISSDSSSDGNILKLFANTMTDQNELQSFRSANILTLSKYCQLEICGYSQNDTTHRRSCEWFTEDSINNKNLTSFKQFDGNFVIMLASCTCKSPSKPDSCKLETCSVRNETKIWKAGECAVLYHETNCNACHFDPVNLMDKQKLLTKNNHNFMSMLVRPDCVVEKETKGFVMKDIRNLIEHLWIDQKKCLNGIVETTQPAFYKDMDNYTCYCKDPPTSFALSELTPTPFSLTESTSTTNTATTSTSSSHSTWDTAIWFVGLGLVITCAAVAICFQRHNMRTTCFNNIRNHINLFKPFPSNESSDMQKQTWISDEENLRRLSTVDNEASENQLKLEIMGEVKRLMDLRLRTFESDDEITTKSNNDGDNVASDIEWNKKLIEKFHEICGSDFVVQRKLFWVSKRDLENPLGSGQFGIVYKGNLKNEQDGSIIKVAIKKISSSSALEGNIVQSFFREIKTFKIINNGSANIVEFMGACCHTTGFYILTMFCEGGSLRKHLIEVLRPKIQGANILEIDENVGDNYYTTDKIKEHRLEESVANMKLKDANLYQMLFWCEEIASGMEYLSKKGIIHVDLATRNILLSGTNNDDMVIKICDFGLSRKCLNQEDYARSLLTGEFPFNSFAPECVTEGEGEPRKISMHLDVWAFGCTVWEIFSLGDVLYPNVTERGVHKFLAVKKLLQEGYIHSKPKLAPEYVYDNAMLKCWENDPRNRPTFTELRQRFGAMRNMVGLEKL